MNISGTGRYQELTRRERQILALIYEGFCSKEIAAKLNIGLKTVENHRSNMLRKLNARSSSHLVRITIH